MSDADAQPRYIPPGSCSWCGHRPHSAACTDRIRTGKATTAPCPCTRHLRLSTGTVAVD